MSLYTPAKTLPVLLLSVSSGLAYNQDGNHHWFWPWNSSPGGRSSQRHCWLYASSLRTHRPLTSALGSGTGVGQRCGGQILSYKVKSPFATFLNPRWGYQEHSRIHREMHVPREWRTWGEVQSWFKREDRGGKGQGNTCKPRLSFRNY